MKTQVYCPKTDKLQIAEIDYNTINIVEGQISFLAKCAKCGGFHPKVQGLEGYKAERKAEL
jgi:hypothetical protein